MIYNNDRATPLGRVRALLLVSVLLPFASPVIAQTLPPAAPPAAPALDPATTARMETQARLTSALSRIAANGSDVQALTQAGRAALSLGDPRAALGFLARAESLAPRDPIIKAALGATMVQLEDPNQAMRFFEAAIALGGLERAYLADRGLAFDLLGDQARAQADYVAAAQFAPSPEVTRRHAISLGISGNNEAAVAMLGPLLRAQDRGAWRSRAMIVAMNGRADEARQIAAATMPPQLASGLSPYFAMMDRLTPQQLAAAAHFGRFPSYEVVAAQQPRVRRTDVAAATTTNPPVRGTVRGQRDGRRVVAANSATGRAAVRTAQRTRAERTVARPAPTPAPALVPPALAPPPPPARAIPFPPMPTPVPALAVPAPSPAPPLPAPPVQPVLRETIRPSIIAPSRAIPPAEAATVSTTPMGPPDSSGRGFTALPAPAVPAPAPIAPIPAPLPAAITTVELPPSTPSLDVPAADDVAARAVVQSPQQLPPMAPAVPAPMAPPANTVVVAGWSLADVAQSIEVPSSERQVEAGALSIDELDAIASQRRRAAAAAAAETRRRLQEETRLRTERETSERDRTAEATAAREAEQVARRHPARTWVQVATGADAAALASDYRRFSQRNVAIFQGQSGAIAVWNRSRRLVVGPFATSSAARAWLNRYAAAGGEGFVWTSDAGEEVTPVARR